MQVFHENTALACWHHVLNDAQAGTGIWLTHETEGYLAWLLVKSIKNSEIISSVLAIDYLNSQLMSGTQRQQALQQVGDFCLLRVGLFPKVANRRLNNQDYFINLGKSAYAQLCDLEARPQQRENVYYLLAKDFRCLVSLLQHFRHHTESQFPAQWQQFISKQH